MCYNVFLFVFIVGVGFVRLSWGKFVFSLIFIRLCGMELIICFVCKSFFNSIVSELKEDENSYLIYFI